MGRDEETVLGLVLVGGVLYYGYKTGIIDQFIEAIGGLLDGAANGLSNIGGITIGGNTTGGSTTGGNTNTGSGITFAAAGDWGSGRNSNWQKVIAVIKSKNPKAVLVVGDQSYTNPSAFKPVTDAIKAMGAKALGSDGNHDGSGYASNFDAYSNSVTNIGNVSFMSLNSNSTSSAITYAKTNLSKMTNAWKVVFFHHPAYTVKSDHGATMGGIHDVIKGKVDLVISGHNHNYQRFSPIDGVTYIVTGLGGESPYGIGANSSGNPPLAKAYNSKFGASIFTTGSNSISGSFINVDGQVIDSFTISKSSAKPAFAQQASIYRVI